MAFIIIRYLFYLVRPTSAPTQGQMTNTRTLLAPDKKHSLSRSVCVYERHFYLLGGLCTRFRLALSYLLYIAMTNGFLPAPGPQILQQEVWLALL